MYIIFTKNKNIQSKNTNSFPAENSELQGVPFAKQIRKRFSEGKKEKTKNLFAKPVRKRASVCDLQQEKNELLSHQILEAVGSGKK